MTRSFIGFAIIFSVFLAILIVKRISTTKKSETKAPETGVLIGAFVYVSLVIFCISGFFFPLSYWFLKESYTLVRVPSYTAEIIGYKSVVEVCEDSDGDSYDCTMHLGIFKFQLEDGTYLTRPGNIQSSAEPEIGKEVKIVYRVGEDKVHQRSLKDIGLYFISLIFWICMGLPLLGAIYYALGYGYEKPLRWGLSFAVNFIMPCSIFFFTGVLGYVVWTFFFMENFERYPYWGIGVCMLFLLMLVPLSLSFIYNWFKTLKKLFEPRTEKE